MSILQLLVIIELILSGIAATLIFGSLYSARDSSAYWAKYYVNDVGSLLSIMHAAEGDATLLYDVIRPGMNVDMEVDHEKFITSAKNTNNFYFFPKDKGMQLVRGKFSNPLAVTIKKEGSQIGLDTYKAWSPPSSIARYIKQNNVGIIILDPGHGIYKYSDTKNLEEDLRYQRDYFSLQGGSIKSKTGKMPNIGNLDPTWLVEDELTIDIARALREELLKLNGNLAIISTRQLDKTKKTSIQGMPAPLDEEWRLGADLYLHSGLLSQEYAHIDEVPPEGADRKRDIRVRAEFANKIASENPDVNAIMISIHSNGGSSTSSGILLLHSDEKQQGGYQNWKDDEALCQALAPDLARYTTKAGMKNKGVIIGSDLSVKKVNINWQKFTTMPTCTLEIGFHNSANDNPILAKASFRSGVGQTLANSIMDCSNMGTCPFTLV